MDLGMEIDSVFVTVLVSILGLKRVSLDVAVLPNAQDPTPLVVYDSRDVLLLSRSGHISRSECRRSCRHGR